MYYLFTWSVIFYNIYCITSLILTIRKSRIDKAQRNKYTIRLIWFSILQIINYVPSTINISIELILRKIPQLFIYIEIFVDSLCGLLYCIVYGYNKDMCELFLVCCRRTSLRDGIDEIDVVISSLFAIKTNESTNFSIVDNILNETAKTS